MTGSGRAHRLKIKPDTEGAVLTGGPLLTMEVITINEELEKRLGEYLQSEAFEYDIGALASDYMAQGLPLPPEEKLRAEAAAEVRKCLETVMVCEAKGHSWTEKADPENGRSELTCSRCGTTEHLQW